MKNISKIILILVGFLLLLSLIGCARQNTPVNTVADSAKESISIIVAAKPECKDVGNVCNSQIDSVTATCNLELDDLNKDVFRWKWSFFGLLIAICVYIIKRII